MCRHATLPCYVHRVGSVEAVLIGQIVSVAVAVLAIVWHQQRTTAALRKELRGEIAGLRKEMRSEIADLRSEIKTLRDEVAANGQRLARIEGYFGIGMPAEAAAAAAGAGIATGAGIAAGIGEAATAD